MGQTPLLSNRDVGHQEANHLLQCGCVQILFHVAHFRTPLNLILMGNQHAQLVKPILEISGDGLIHHHFLGLQAHEFIDHGIQAGQFRRLQFTSR